MDRDERGIGRGQSTFYSNMMRMEVASGIKPVSQVNLPITTWPAGASRYLYGVYFFNFLEETYGRESVDRLVDEYSINLVPFSMNSTFMRVFDNDDVETVWRRYSEWLQARYEPEIDAIRKQGEVAGTMVADQRDWPHDVRFRALRRQADSGGIVGS